MNHYLSDLPQLNEEEIESMEKEVTIQEIIKGIDQLGKEKCPGLDGLTCELYKTFSGPMSKILLWLLNEVTEKKIMPKSLRIGVTTLIYKKGDALDLNNWRPVTMSNVDYKVFAQVFKNRMLPIVSKLVGPYQTCNIPGRSIFDNLHFMRDNMDMDGAVLAIDQAGAFNNVDHNYLIKVLEAFGFPAKFREYIRIMYYQISIFGNVGGDLVGPIPYEKGVKQGDPMASILYVLALEPLLRRLHVGMLRISPSPFPKHPKTNISGYADDTNLFISHQDQFDVISDELSLFSAYSGGKVNMNKTELLLCGNWQDISHRTQYNAHSDGLKILGIWFGKAANRNWEMLMSNFKLKLEFYKTRSSASSFHAKVQVLNRFLLPILWYVCKVLDPPADFVTSIKKLCEDFLWGTRKQWVKRTLVYAPREYGGFGVKDLEVQVLAMRIKDTIKVFSTDQNNYFLSNYVHSIRELVMVNTHQENDFYNNIRLKCNIIKLRFRCVTNEILGNIGIQNVCVFPNLDCEQLVMLGLTTVKSILDWDGESGPERLTAAKRRKLSTNLIRFREQLRNFQKECDVEESKPIKFTCDNPITNIEDINKNLYEASFFGVYQTDGISRGDLLKMGWGKWSNFAKLQIPNPEKDVTYRLWHNSLLTFSLASRMGLCVTTDCPFCAVPRPTSLHMVHCGSTLQLWEFLVELFKKMGITEKPDKLNGFKKSKLGNSIIFLSHSVLYNRILYTINSGNVDFHLTKAFKQRLSERLMLEFGSCNNKTYLTELFKHGWNNGLGLFEICDNQLVIRI